MSPGHHSITLLDQFLTKPNGLRDQTKEMVQLINQNWTGPTAEILIHLVLPQLGSAWLIWLTYPWQHYFKLQTPSVPQTCQLDCLSININHPLHWASSTLTSIVLYIDHPLHQLSSTWWPLVASHSFAYKLTTPTMYTISSHIIILFYSWFIIILELHMGMQDTYFFYSYGFND